MARVGNVWLATVHGAGAHAGAHAGEDGEDGVFGRHDGAAGVVEDGVLFVRGGQVDVAGSSVVAAGTKGSGDVVLAGRDGKDVVGAAS